MADELAGSARIRISLDDAGAVAEAELLGRRVEAALDRATRRIDATVRRNLQRAFRIPVRVDMDTSAFAAPVRLAGLAGGDAGDRFGAAFNRAADRSVAQFGRVFTRAVSGVAGAVGVLGKVGVAAAGFSVLAVEAAAAAASLIAFTAAVAPAAGIVAALPAVLGVGAAAVGTLAVAFAGLGDAFDALTGPVDKFDEALQNLSPNARGFAKELRGLVPSFDRLRSTVQDSFFAPLAGDVTRVASALSGPLTAGMSRVAAQFGGLTSHLADFARSAETVSAVESVFSSLSRQVDNLGVAVGPLAAGFRDAFTAGLGPLERMSVAAGLFGKRLGEALTAAAGSGRLEQILNTALDTLSQLGRIAGQVGSILSRVFDAASTSGGSLLDTIETTLAGLNQFLGSEQGIATLASVFDTLRVVGAQVSPIIVAVAGAIGKIAPTIADIATAAIPAIAGLATAFGDAFAAAGPGLTALVAGIAAGVQALAPALTPLGQALGSIGVAAAPFFTALGQALAELAPALGPIADLFGRILNIITPLLVPVGQLVTALVGMAATALTPVAAALQVMAQALAPVIGLVGQAFTSAVEALAPNITALADAFSTAFVPAITALTTALAPLLPQIAQLAAEYAQNLAPVVPVLAQAFGELALALVPVIEDMGKQLLDALIQLAPQIPAIASAVVTMATSFAQLVTAVAPFLPQILDLLTNTELMQAVIGGLVLALQLAANTFLIVAAAVNAVVGVFQVASGAVSTLGGIVSRTWDGIKSATSSAISAVVGAVTSLPGKISGLAGRMLAAGKRLIGSLIDGMKGVGGRVADIAGAITGALKSFINSNVIGPIERGVNAFLPGDPVHIPRLANGALLTRPTLFLGGEAGEEVVIPLTRPRRARQLAEQSGLLDVLAAAGAKPSAAAGAGAGGVGSGISNTFNLYEVGDAEVTARRVINRMMLAAVV